MEKFTENEAERRIKELCDGEFLYKLREVGKLFGWMGDYCEIRGFIGSVHSIMGIDDIDLEPYEIID